jgi:[ribosomal protein S18]-alanine N-acetyltransferase
MIRIATLDDLGSILSLEQTFGAEAFSRRSLRHFVMCGSTLVIEHKDVVIGYSIVMKRKGSSLARLYSITIDEQWRGRGYSKQLLSASEEAARSHGLNRMTLEVAESNSVAISLYQLAGYTQKSRIPSYYASGEACFKLYKDL